MFLDHQAPHYLETLKDLQRAAKALTIILETLANVNLAKDLKVLAVRGTGRW